MTQAANDNITPAFKVSDLSTDIDGVPRLLDILLAERLGMEHPRNIRDTIAKRHAELSMHGEVLTAPIATTAKGGRPGVAYYLNEAQALLLCMFANTRVAVRVRKMLIDVFMEYRRGRLPAAATVPEPQMALASVAALIGENIAKMERAVADIRAIAEEKSRQADRCLSAMVINGEPVLVDMSDFDLADGEHAVVIKQSGKIAVERVSFLDAGNSNVGERTAYGPKVANGIGTCRERVVVIGKIIRGRWQSPDTAPDKRAAIVTPQAALPAPKRRRPMDANTRARVLRLFRENRLPLWEIAEIVGYPYHMVQRLTWAAEKSRSKYQLRVVSA